MEDLRCALGAFEKRDVEGRTRAVNHAITVIGQLQGTLNMELGGRVALNLDRFYHILRAGLIEAQAKQSAKLLHEQIAYLAVVHGAWLEVERKAAPHTEQPKTPTHFMVTDQTSFPDWSG
jgi:flagellar protein FliS